MEFQSGVLLCSVVEKVEYMCCIQGVCRKANLTKANALYNISKALEILQQRKVRLPITISLLRLPSQANFILLRVVSRRCHCTSCGASTRSTTATAALSWSFCARSERCVHGAIGTSRHATLSDIPDFALLKCQAYGHHHHHLGTQSSFIVKPSTGATANKSQSKAYTCL